MSCSPTPNPGTEQIARSAKHLRIEDRIKLYAITAAAASVGMLAMAKAADAEVIIKNTHIPIAPRSLVTLDLNNDGIADVDFNFFQTTAHYFNLGYVAVGAAQGGAVVERQFGALALARSAKIGPSASFGGTSGNQNYVMEQQTCSSDVCKVTGNWVGNRPNRFVGIKFKIGGKTHYGWIRVTMKAGGPFPITAAITEYGYETVANRLVKAGLPSKARAAKHSTEQRASVGGASLGMLARGADALAVWRRE